MWLDMSAWHKLKTESLPTAFIVIIVLSLSVNAESDRRTRQQSILAMLESYQTPSSQISLQSAQSSSRTVNTTSYSAPAILPDGTFNIIKNSGHDYQEIHKDDEYSDNIIPTLPPIVNTWITLNRRKFQRQTTQLTTPQPTWSEYELWYYQDTSGYVQGPFTADTMWDWNRARYFRTDLLIRREADEVFKTLQEFSNLYGRVPFSKGDHPMSLTKIEPTQILPTTSKLSLSTTITTTTTSTTTTTTTRLTTSTTTRPTTERTITLMPELITQQMLSEDFGPSPRNDCATKNCDASIEDGTIRLTGGRDDTEGNVEIYHKGVWGGICDDEWDNLEANIACKSLGFSSAVAATHGSRYGNSPNKIWMDSMYCYGTEESLQKCRFDGWGVHDCQMTEAAGVQCKALYQYKESRRITTTTTKKPKQQLSNVANRIKTRLRGGRSRKEGRLEVRIDQGKWGVICGDGWGIREAIVACNQLGLDYASSAVNSDIFGGGKMPRVVSGITCNGNEQSLLECDHDDVGDLFCPGEGMHDIAGVVCTERQADLQPDLMELMTSAYLEDKTIFQLQCAMEENCLASQAYVERHDSFRRLLRFTTAIENVGSADFRPFIPKSAWEWHDCHKHYHSMETFSHFEIFDTHGRRMVEGHKASFCLEDNACTGSVQPLYSCANYGNQGISAGCTDVYYNNIDCQWIDITDLEIGTYVFKMAINPEYKIAEVTFENNAALCILYYSQMTAVINNCTLVRP